MTLSMKIIPGLILLALMLIPFRTENASVSIIGGADGPTAVFVTAAGDTYRMEVSAGGIEGAFTVTLSEDGTFIFYEHPVSSYIGLGTYTVSDGILTLTEDAPGCRGAVNRFLMEEDSIRFIQEGSDNFAFIPLEDGAAFTK